MELFLVVPELFKELEKVVSILKILCLLHRIVGVVAALTTEIDCRKSIDGHIGAFIDRQEAHHLLLRDVRFENRFAFDPVGTFFGNRFLCQLIAELYFKLRAVKTALSGNARNIKFTLRFWRFFRHKSGRGKDKMQRIDFF